MSWKNYWWQNEVSESEGQRAAGGTVPSVKLRGCFAIRVAAVRRRCDRREGRSKVNYDGAGRVAAGRISEAGRQVESLFESLLSQSFEGGRQTMDGENPMTDMLVKLHNLPESLTSFSNLVPPEIKIRKPMGSEKSLIVQWVRENFGEFWASETDITFSRSPISCYIAQHDKARDRKSIDACLSVGDEAKRLWVCSHRLGWTPGVLRKSRGCDCYPRFNTRDLERLAGRRRMTAKKDSPANLQEEFAPTLLFGDASQSALLPSAERCDRTP
jgi:hypothetical protein